MPRCCGNATCSCLIQSANAKLTITGSGQAADPYILTNGVSLGVTDNSVFDLTLTGGGTVASPWALTVAFAGTAKLDDLPDVNASAPTNTQVLSWDTATSKWIPRAPTTAASGSISHDTAFVGDGSGGSPLGINEDTAGFLVTAAGGLGLSTTGKNRLVMHYANFSTRASTAPTPDLNTLSTLDSVPGRLDYWNGTAWVEYGMFAPNYVGQMFALSGSYTATSKVSLYVLNITTTTDAGGRFDVLSTADLTGKAGVLGAWFQPTTSTVFAVVLENNITKVSGHAYRISDGADHASQSVAGVVLALVY